MKPSAVLILSPLFLSCTVHLHIHEASKAPDTAFDGLGHSQGAPHELHRVRGFVRDDQGAGVEARIAVVRSVGGGSNSTTSQPDGEFALPGVQSPAFALHASTEDGRVAVAGSQLGRSEFELVLRPGAILAIELEGREKARCAVFAGELRIEDFTLRAGVPMKVVVPPGEQRVQIYEGDKVLEERRFSTKVGQTEVIRMQSQ